MLDIQSNRRDAKYTYREMGLRLAWGLAKWLFRLTPRPFHALRAAILRMFGARIGDHVHVYPTAQIYFPWNLEIGDWSAIGEQAFIYNLGKVTIGARSTVSHRAHLCAGTHDYTRSSLPLLKPPISIGDDAWVASEAFVGPGVAIGDGAVIGARAVVVKDVPSWMVVAGNPARVVKRRQLADDHSKAPVSEGSSTSPRP